MLKRTAILTAVGILAHTTAITPASAAPIDLNDWTAESYIPASGFSPGIWNVTPTGDAVLQTVNGQPTIFYSDFTAFGTNAEGRIQVTTTSDNDFVGFVLGFNPGDATNPFADYLLVDWKQGSQGFDFDPPSTSPGGTAPAGLAVSRVRGIPDADEFWQHANLSGTPMDTGLEELARANTLGSTGWLDDGTDYLFEFDFGPNNLQVFVDGTLEIDITGSFNNGRLGFYNFSQRSVRYSAFTVQAGSFPAPEPGTMGLLGVALAGVGALRRRR